MTSERRFYETHACEEPYSDLKPKVKSYTDKKWQEEWEEQIDNTLFNTRPDLKEFLPSAAGSRKESVLCRLRTGHSFYTHGFLLKGEDQPWCYGCNTIVPIKHVLIDCWDIFDTRRKYYNVDNLKVLFRDVHPDNIKNFLKEVNIFNVI